MVGMDQMNSAHQISGESCCCNPGDGVANNAQHLQPWTQLLPEAEESEGSTLLLDLQCIVDSLQIYHCIHPGFAYLISIFLFAKFIQYFKMRALYLPLERFTLGFHVVDNIRLFSIPKLSQERRDKVTLMPLTSTCRTKLWTQLKTSIYTFDLSKKQLCSRQSQYATGEMISTSINTFS